VSCYAVPVYTDVAACMPVTDMRARVILSQHMLTLLRSPRFSEDSEVELPSVKPELLPDDGELKM
jgi:hypothetical protein